MNKNKPINEGNINRSSDLLPEVALFMSRGDSAQMLLSFIK